MGSAVINLAEQVSLDTALVVEVAHADACQANMHAFLPDVVEQFECNRHEDVLIVGRMRQPALCRTPAAIRILKLERYRGTRQPLTAQAASH